MGKTSDMMKTQKRLGNVIHINWSRLIFEFSDFGSPNHTQLQLF